MAQEDDEKAAREARAARLRSKIGRMTGGPNAGDQEGGTDGAATNETGEARGVQSDTGLDEQSWTGTSESPRDFIDRKMREEKEEGGKE